MKIRQHVHGEIAAKRSVAVAAIATISGDLDRALIELDVVGLMSVGCGIEAGDRNVDRSVDRYVEVDEAPREMPVTAGAVAMTSEPIRPSREEVKLVSPPIAALPLPPLPPTPAI